MKTSPRKARAIAIAITEEAHVRARSAARLLFLSTCAAAALLCLPGLAGL